MADAIDALANDVAQTDAIQGRIRAKATDLGIDPALALSIAHQESGFNPQAMSPTGVVGLYQVTMPTGRPYGQLSPADRMNPDVSMHAGLSYFRDLLNETGGNVPQALMRYNGGSDPNYAANVMQHYPLHAAATQTDAGGDPLDALAREMGVGRPPSPQGPPAPTTGPSASAPTIVPNRDPSQPATVVYPGQAPAGPAPSPDQPEGSVRASFPPPAASVQLQPGMRDEDIIKAFGYDPALIQQAKLYQPGALSSRITDPNSTLAKVAGTSLIPGTDTATLGGVIHGLRQIPAGTLQLAARGLRAAGLYGDADVAYHDLLEKVAEADYQQNILHGKNVDPETGQPSMWDIGTMVGMGASPLPIPGGGAAKTVLGGLGRSAVTGAVAGGLQPVLDTSTTPGSPQDTFGTQKLTQTAAGAVAGPVVEYGLVRPLMWGVNKAINLSRGMLAHPADAEVLDLASAHGVDTTYGDVRGAMQAPGATRTETQLEKLPGAGGGAFRQQQQGQVKNAAETFQQHYVGAMNVADYDALPQVQRFAARGDGAAQRAVDLAAQAGNDPGRIMRASADLNLQAARGHAQELYGRVRQLAQPLGDVPPTRTLNQAYAALDAIQNSTLNVDPTGSTKAQIERILDRLEPKTVTSPPDQFYRTTTTTTTPPSPYNVMDKLSNDLGTVINQTNMQDTYGAKILSAVKDAVDGDMRDFALQSGKPDLVLAQHAADAFYPQVVRQRELVRSMDKVNSDELTRYMFQPRRGERAEQWFNALDSKGQAAARAEILTQALYDGPNPGIQPTTGTFSPARFAGNLERLRAVTGVTFPKGGELRWQLDGFVNLMRHVERAGQYAENPPTGQRLSSWFQTSQALGGAIAGTAVGGPLVGIAATAAPLATEAALGRLAKVLLMSPTGRDFLLSASNLQPGSPAMQRLAQAIADRLPSLTAQLAGSAAGGKPTAEEPEPGPTYQVGRPIPLTGNVR